MTLLSSQDLEPVTSIEAGGAVVSLDWSQDGRWLAAGCSDKALLLFDIPAGAADRIVDFPSAVSATCFSKSGQALIASGAFRVVGWKLPDLPFGDHGGTPIETGRPGLTLVETVAAHPKRDLCAVGYANGLVTICRIGQRDEMMLREGTGQGVTALAWSSDGAHLAMGTEDGRAAIVAFPKSMFK